MANELSVAAKKDSNEPSVSQAGSASNNGDLIESILRLLYPNGKGLKLFSSS
jgi:hypothetical protein